MTLRAAVVTGASSGIGAATARALAATGCHVYCAARRADRVEALAGAIGGTAVPCDVADPAAVARLAAAVGDRLDLLVNTAGGALGLDPVESADFGGWERMYQTNVLGTARVTQVLLPALRAAAGTVVLVTSTAADDAYEGGAGYCGVKAAEHSLVRALRLELNGEPVRVLEMSPGMVKTDEFSLTRFGGDRARADAVYAGVAEPLTAEDIADAIVWAATRPAHVNVDQIIIRPVAQASNHKVHRTR
ncbi:MAG: SDR family NAD(P)-dependent oxidoreductase [Propionibacteriaceae bacterium]|jgi:NADP-dependent 3-hydroxy acid dehydrogenase YdfG|nr:SDR family NAD(P)-dependent oxidoreductase [Propionibacteriaceae bacterium]